MNGSKLDHALETTAQIIGINNRNLAAFETDLGVTEKVSEQGPDEIVLVSESGIRTGRGRGARASLRSRCCPDWRSAYGADGNNWHRNEERYFVTPISARRFFALADSL
jgi:hypothetical protein